MDITQVFAPAPSPLAPLEDRLASLPRFYAHREVLEIVFGGDEDLFLDAWCDGSLPLNVRATCTASMGEALLGVWLQRRSCRLQAEILAALGAKSGNPPGWRM